MKYFIALRANDFTQAGQWWMAEEIGEEVFQCRLLPGPDGSRFVQDSQIAIPFDVLAKDLVELDFRIPMKQAVNRAKAATNSTAIIQEVENFQRENEEMIEDGFMKKKREEFPSFRTKGGVFVNVKKEDTK